MALAFLISDCNGDIGGPRPPGPPWVVFTKSNSPLPDSTINSIFIDNGVQIWIATGSGAALLNNHSWSVFKDSLTYLTYDHENNSYIVSNVNTITRTKDQSIWFALRGGAL